MWGRMGLPGETSQGYRDVSAPPSDKSRSRPAVSHTTNPGPRGLYFGCAQSEISSSPRLNLAAFITIVFTYSSTFYSIRIVAFKAERSICSSKLPSQSRFFFIVFADARCRAPSSPRAALPATAGSQVNPHS